MPSGRQTRLPANRWPPRWVHLPVCSAWSGARAVARSARPRRAQQASRFPFVQTRKIGSAIVAPNAATGVIASAFSVELGRIADGAHRHLAALGVDQDGAAHRVGLGIALASPDEEGPQAQRAFASRRELLAEHVLDRIAAPGAAVLDQDPAHALVDACRSSARPAPPPAPSSASAPASVIRPGPGSRAAVRTGEKKTGRNPRNEPMADTQSVACSPMKPPRNPPMRAPIGIVPHTMSRIVAFMRPIMRSGVIACRRPDLVHVVDDGREAADDAAGDEEPERIVAAVRAGRRPARRRTARRSRRWSARCRMPWRSRPPVSAPSSTPMLPMAKIRPIVPALSASSLAHPRRCRAGAGRRRCCRTG